MMLFLDLKYLRGTIWRTPTEDLPWRKKALREIGETTGNTQKLEIVCLPTIPSKYMGGINHMSLEFCGASYGSRACVFSVSLPRWSGWRRWPPRTPAPTRACLLLVEILVGISRDPTLTNHKKSTWGMFYVNGGYWSRKYLSASTKNISHPHQKWWSHQKKYPPTETWRLQQRPPVRHQEKNTAKRVEDCRSGGFLKWGVPKMVGLLGEIQKWMMTRATPMT